MCVWGMCAYQSPKSAVEVGLAGATELKNGSGKTTQWDSPGEEGLRQGNGSLAAFLLLSALCIPVLL